MVVYRVRALQPLQILQQRATTWLHRQQIHSLTVGRTLPRRQKKVGAGMRQMDASVSTHSCLRLQDQDREDESMQNVRSQLLPSTEEGAALRIARLGLSGNHRKGYLSEKLMSHCALVQRRYHTDISTSIGNVTGAPACMHWRRTGPHHCLCACGSSCCLPVRRGISLFGGAEGSAWSRAVAEAEKIVGYPTSFMGLRCLLSDELSNVAMQVRKLIGTKHPLVKTARGFLYDGKHNVQTRGLIILLVAKAAGPSRDDDEGQVMVRGIYPSQRTLAEIAEMIHTAFLVHRGVVNIRDLLPSDGPRHVMEFGNKMAVLSGDFLLASACRGLAELRNTRVVDLLSQAISDLTEAAFMPFSEDDLGWGSLSPSPRPGVSDWARYAYLSSGSLVAKGCRAALELAGHDEEMQRRGYEFGKNISLAQQLHQELQMWKSKSLSEISLTSAPVLLHYEGSGDQERVWDQTKVDIQKLHREVMSGPALRKSQDLLGSYTESARRAIVDFPQCNAKEALLNMLQAVS